MTHEDRARKIYRELKRHMILQTLGTAGKSLEFIDEEEVVKAISKALAEAEKKGREEERKSKNVVVQEIWIKEPYIFGWNEAIYAAVKVANDTACNQCLCGNHTIIADKLKGLRK